MPPLGQSVYPFDEIPLPPRSIPLSSTIWFFNIAMENPLPINGCFHGKFIYKLAIYTMAMLNNQRVTIFVTNVVTINPIIFIVILAKLSIIHLDGYIQSR